MGICGDERQAGGVVSPTASVYEVKLNGIADQSGQRKDLTGLHYRVTCRERNAKTNSLARTVADALNFDCQSPASFFAW